MPIRSLLRKPVGWVEERRPPYVLQSASPGIKGAVADQQPAVPRIPKTESSYVAKNQTPQLLRICHPRPSDKSLAWRLPTGGARGNRTALGQFVVGGENHSRRRRKGLFKAEKLDKILLGAKISRFLAISAPRRLAFFSKETLIFTSTLSDG